MTDMIDLPKLFGSTVRSEVLRILFGPHRAELHLRAIHRETGLAIRGIQRELVALQEMNLLINRRDGNRLYFQANTMHPLYTELRSIVLKSSRVEEAWNRPEKAQKEAGTFERKRDTSDFEDYLL
jgi:hypothetical protein